MLFEKDTLKIATDVIREKVWNEREAKNPDLYRNLRENEHSEVFEKKVEGQALLFLYKNLKDFDQRITDVILSHIYEKISGIFAELKQKEGR